MSDPTTLAGILLLANSALGGTVVKLFYELLKRTDAHLAQSVAMANESAEARAINRLAIEALRTELADFQTEVRSELRRVGDEVRRVEETVSEMSIRTLGKPRTDAQEPIDLTTRRRGDGA